MMSNIERFNFVLWAVDNFPSFTTTPDQYERAISAWERRKDQQHLAQITEQLKRGAAQ